ncbi:MAG: ribonuclease E inhibitor RraB [Gammaproteobacteria bacterium]|nr:MAG: ribonuclease E inhibitor RraB [Gammaproteobacteria bacterium]
MFWLIVAFGAATAIIVARIYFNMRKLQGSRTESWDAKVIERLRSQGYAPFNNYQVDFFLALPDETACRGVRARLEPEGFSVDVKPMENDPELCFSLHASKSMRICLLAERRLRRFQRPAHWLFRARGKKAWFFPAKRMPVRRRAFPR